MYSRHRIYDFNILLRLAKINSFYAKNTSKLRRINTINYKCKFVFQIRNICWQIEVGVIKSTTSYIIQGSFECSQFKLAIDCKDFKVKQNSVTLVNMHHLVKNQFSFHFNYVNKTHNTEINHDALYENVIRRSSNRQKNNRKITI